MYASLYIQKAFSQENYRRLSKMGSLMAGWDAPVRDPKAVTYRRNSSLTKGEIEAYWRKKRTTEEEHLRAISGSLDAPQENKPMDTGKMYQRSSSLPMPSREKSFTDMETETSLEKLIKKNGWWTRSNSAFLNEPPVIASEGPTYKYASQYHVTSFNSTEQQAHHGISA